MKYAPILLASGLASLISGTALAGGLGALVTPAELAAASAEAPVILDIRAKGFTDGHIAGAVSAPYGLFRGPADNPGAVPPVDKLEATYESLGLDPARPVVIVSQGDTDTDFGAAARVYWTLKSSGFTELSVLNGGQIAWVNAGLPISTIAGTPTPTELSIAWNPSWTADTSAVADIVEGKSEAVLVDARPAAFFEGKKAHEAAARPGTLPGAENLPYTEFFRAGATAIDVQSDVSALKTRLGISANEEVVSFCNTGHWAATDWFALSELAGIENVKLYPGSMVEYSKTEGEMANQPGILDNLLNQITGTN
ncbi:sulfurtransferase [Sinirhodobacter sp. WL0062]|uniref:Sulfurtransferase n=1 Tax=Rhodobacter flavimaris TaxID=2907145 RepID=A0ABS8Z025_9RHOB|nr:rhodanese-like domain-containing protein [Sinirhodobacter sp. WL0062]MCE5975143.1 sulfurtransferase [Sinirhodobacter sp. WL0062]